MAKIRTYSVVLEADTLEFVIRKVLKAYPKEAGAFLRGESVEKRKNVFLVDGYYYPPEDSETTNSTWFWYTDDWFKATKWAATNNNRIVGIVHSHPWTKPYFSATNQSIMDANIQKEHALAVSLIINIWKNNNSLFWWITGWLDGFSASLNLYIKKDGIVYTTHQWFCKSEFRFQFPWNFAKWSAL